MTMKYFHWIPAIACASFIFYVSGKPSLGLPSFPQSDKIMHMIAYAVLAYFVARALHKVHSFGYMKLIFIGMFIAGLYGLSDEIHQMFVPTRSADAFDLLADFMGGLMGAIIYAKLLQNNKECH